MEHPGESGYLLLGNGLDAFVARVLLAQQAGRSIDTQYYMIHGDVVGSLFINQLYKAAERGVRLCLLVDDIDQEGRDEGAAILDSHPNVEVRIFKPFARNAGRTGQYVTGFGKQTRRAHNKSFTVDNQATILGGRNIGDEYFEADPELSFVDLDVLAVGPVAGQVSASFDQYWNSELSYPVSALVDQPPASQEIAQRKQKFDEFVAQQVESEYLQYLRHSDLTQRVRQNRVVYHWGPGTVVADDPEKLTHDTSETKYHLSEQLRSYLTEIQDELNQNLTEEQRKAKKEGGIGRSKSSLHAKCFILDRETAFIGSLNLYPRSIVENTEIGVVFKSTAIAAHIADMFDGKIDQAAFRLELRK